MLRGIVVVDRLLFSWEGFGEGQRFEFEKRVVGGVNGSCCVEGAVSLQMLVLSAVNKSLEHMGFDVVVAIFDGSISLFQTFRQSGPHKMEARQAAT